MGNAAAIELARQPFPTIDIDLDRIRRPALQTDMHPAELGIDQVPVEMQALARAAHHLQPFGFPVAGHRERPARLQGRERADQAHPVILGNSARQRLLGGARGVGMGGVQVDERPAAVVGQHLGVGFQARRLGFEERARVLEQNVAAVQVALERSLGKQRVEMALENQASSDRAGYRVPVQITESGHVDLARVRWFTSSKVGAAISLKSIWRAPDRRRLWLWPQAALSSAPYA